MKKQAKTILLVEDEAVIALMQKETLEKHGFKVITATSGEAAVTTVNDTPGIDLILMDIDLPDGIDGTEAAGIILADHDLPIIFVSSHTSPEIVQKTEGITSYGYVVKNSGEMVLLASIRMAFRLYDAHMRVEERNRQLQTAIEEYDAAMEEIEATNEELMRSEEKLMERERSLSESEEKYRALFNQSFQGVFLHDTDGNITEVNEMACLQSGYSRKELLNMEVFDFHPESPLQTEDEIIKQWKEWQPGMRIEVQAEHMRKDGTVYPVEISTGPVRYSDRTLILALVHDITERKQSQDELEAKNEELAALNEEFESANEELKERDNLLTGIFESIQDGISVLNKDLTIRQTNNSIKQWHSDVLPLEGKKCFEAYQNRTEPCDICPSLRAIKSGRIENDEVTVKNGRRDRWIEIFAYPLKEPGSKRTTGVVEFVRDITERKESEEKVRSLLEEKDIILKETCHRIKNNMDTVRSLLALQALSQDDPNSRQILNDAAGRIQSMSLLYDKLYRSETYNELDINTYLASLINEITGVMQPPVPVKTEIKIENFTISSRLFSPIGIIVNELITNSMKHAFSETKSGLIRVSVSKKNNRVTLTYSDNGKGLPENLSTDNSRTFGMRLVDMMVKQLRGSLDIKKNKEKGAEFVVQFDL